MRMRLSQSLYSLTRAKLRLFNQSLKMENTETGKTDEAEKKPFIIKTRWIVIAVLAYMLIFNYLLYRDAQSVSSGVEGKQEEK